MTIEITPKARIQLTEFAAWWDENRPDARVRVADALAKALDAIANHPQLGRLYPRGRRYRSWRLKGTPYLLIYRIDAQAQKIFVLAAWSTMRGRGPRVG